MNKINIQFSIQSKDIHLLVNDDVYRKKNSGRVSEKRILEGIDKLWMSKVSIESPALNWLHGLQQKILQGGAKPKVWSFLCKR